MRPIVALLILMIISACDILPQAVTPTPTRNFSAPTIVPSPTVQIFDSQALYGDSQVGGFNNPTAAALPNTGALPALQSGTDEASGVTTAQIVLENGTIINASLYAQSQANRVPGILIIGENQQSWGNLPAEIFARGMSVLVVTLPTTHIADLDVLLTSLSEEASVDPARLAIIGERQYADMALLGCAAYPICDAVVLLSPTNPDTLLNVLPNYDPRPLFVVSSRTDTNATQAGAALVANYAEASQWLEVATGAGTTMLALNSDLGRAIADWLALTFSG